MQYGNNTEGSQILTAASASCFFLAMLEAVLSCCFSNSLFNSKINEVMTHTPKNVLIITLCKTPSYNSAMKREFKVKLFSLFFLCPHVWSNNKPLHGEVENQWSNCGVKYSTRQKLVSEVNWEGIRLAGSV